MKLEPKDSMRAIEYLCQLYPKKTGKEILEISEHDKKCHELWIRNKHKYKNDLIDKINAETQYYKGRFGTDQRYFYKVSNAQLSGETIRVTVEKVVVFLGDKGDVLKEGNIQIEKTIDSYADFDDYRFEIEKKTTKDEWDGVVNYLRGVSKFWNDIKER